MLAACLAGLNLCAQQASPYVKFGKITADELDKKIYSIDSSADAVVLSDRGETAVEGNSKGWFSVTFTHHRVVHILNKNGYFEADVAIPLFNKGQGEEKLDEIKAVTYNLENGKIVETKLDKSGIFTEKINQNLSARKFTFPNVKEGCIIEYEYKVISDYIENLDPWAFQGRSPVLWSEYMLSVPQFFNYAFLSHGYLPMYIYDHQNHQSTFTVSDGRSSGSTERYNFTAGVTDYRWVIKDVPELRQESFTSTLRNHLARIDFQLASQSDPLPPHDYRATWDGLIKELNESDHFGAQLNSNNGWLSDDLNPVLAGAKTDLEKAQRIYNFVRDNFTCTDHDAVWLDQPLKATLKARRGSVAEINLLLVAMLHRAGLNAHPVLVSTTGHGYALPSYPMLNSFNYVIVETVIDNAPYYLDASHPRLGFSKLMPECYNGAARVVDDMATSIQFSADSVKERKVTAIFISDDKGKWTGNMNQTLGYFESCDIRDRVKEKGEDDLFKGIEKNLGSEVKILTHSIDSLNNFDDPVELHYDLEIPRHNEDVLYINPLFGEGYKKNPFKSAERFYPVEMPFTSDETVILTMDVPEGYVVDELPKQVVAKLDEQGSAYFEYRISQSENTISLRMRIKISRTLYMPDEYEALRQFFNLIVNKQNEQIVLKKKK